MAKKRVSALGREIAARLSVERIKKRWRAKLSSYQRAIAALESDRGDLASARRALDGLHKIVDEMAMYTSRSHADPDVGALQVELGVQVEIFEAQNRKVRDRQRSTVDDTVVACPAS